MSISLRYQRRIRILGDDARDLRQDPPAEFVTAHSESTTLGVRQAKRPRAQVFSEDPILLPEIVDQIVLVTVHPASEREDEELQRRRHSLRLLGRLDQHRPSLGRFFAPYAVRDAIDRDELEGGLDRLHTFVTKYVRALCEACGLAIDRDKPLHSLFGEYVKHLRQAGALESEMTARILKSSISTLEAFNNVRNNRSLAHDNPVLGYEEALLIFNHVASSVRFLRSVDRAAGERERAAEDEIPF